MSNVPGQQDSDEDVVLPQEGDDDAVGTPIPSEGDDEDADGDDVEADEDAAVVGPDDETA